MPPVWHGEPATSVTCLPAGRQRSDDDIHLEWQWAAGGARRQPSAQGLVKVVGSPRLVEAGPDKSGSPANTIGVTLTTPCPARVGHCLSGSLVLELEQSS